MLRDLHEEVRSKGGVGESQVTKALQIMIKFTDTIRNVIQVAGRK